MDMETVRLIGVGVCTLLAGVVGALITAGVTARNSRKQREEDRFIWKREKLIELVPELLDLSRENTDLMRLSQDFSDATRISRMHRASELVILLDSGIVAMAAPGLINAELDRLTAFASVTECQRLSDEDKEGLQIKCVEGRASLTAAMRMLLGDPTQPRDMKRYTSKR